MTDNQQLPFDIVTLPKLGKFLTVVDATAIGKVKFMLTTYDKTTKAAISSAEAYLDVDRARVLCHLMKNPPAEGAKPTVFQRFGGGHANGEVQSRVIKVDYDTAGGKFSEIPWRFEITVSRGIHTATGGIEPDPSDTNKRKEFVRLSTEEVLLMALTLEAFFAARAEFIFGKRYDLQQEKRQKRFDSKGTKGFSLQPARSVLPIEWRGYAAGTPLTDLDNDTLKIIAQKSEKNPLLASEAQGILFARKA